MEAPTKAREDDGFGNFCSSEGKILHKDVSEANKIKTYFVKQCTSRHYSRP